MGAGHRFCLRLGPVTRFVGECASIHTVDNAAGLRHFPFFAVLLSLPDLKYLRTSVPLSCHEEKDVMGLWAAAGARNQLGLSRLTAS